MIRVLVIVVVVVVVLFCNVHLIMTDKNLEENDHDDGMTDKEFCRE